MISIEDGIYYHKDECEFVEGETYGVGWYFTAEDYSFIGPYTTRQEAKDARQKYFEVELG